MSLPKLHLMPRVQSDIDRCVEFVAQQPWGKPSDRELDIYQGFAVVRAYPKVYRAEAFRQDSNLWLRRYRMAQFVIIYAHMESSDPSLPDVVSIRAVRHVREKDVFAGVKEPPTAPASPDSVNAADAALGF